jgi:hemerythrin-like domain-containing protein
LETTRCLREEHQLILRVLDCFERAIAHSRKSGQATAEVYAPFVEFFRGFADKCHHCKEEDRLFPQLVSQGIPREGGPIGCMLREHKMGRAHIKVIGDSIDAADSGDENAMQRIFYQGDAYIELLRNHIAKEDGVLFEMADQVVQGTELTQLTDAYAEAESDPEYVDTIRRCRAIAERLIQTYLRPKA